MSALTELRGVLSDVVTDPDVMEGYRRDQAPFAAAGHPLAVVRPSSTAEVQALAQWASRHHVPLVPRGAGTGLAGGACAIDGGVVVSFERMNRILSIDAAAMTAVVQPGVFNAQLKEAVRPLGLWYPPDPSSFEICTLGGNVATNAGGLCCVKYGVTSDWVLGLEAVLADGTVIRTGGRTRKNVAGYDLTRLLVGSEGTLALITEITLRLRNRLLPATTVVATFDSLAALGRAVGAIVTSATASLLEIMDQTTLRAVEAYRRMDLDTSARAMLIAQSDQPGSAELAVMQQACRDAGATFVATTEDEAEGKMFLAARRMAFPALMALGTTLVDDVAVPIPLLPEMMQRIETVAARADTQVATVAHAGDGNLHPLVVFDNNDSDARERAVATFNEIMAQALELGGTITGEHGVGTLKRAFLGRQLGPHVLALHDRIKRAFDPEGLLNPGKVIDWAG